MLKFPSIFVPLFSTPSNMTEPSNSNDSNSSTRDGLPKLEDADGVNNYGEWKTKAELQLLSWDLLKYVTGPESSPPIIPDLHPSFIQRGSDPADPTGALKLFRVHGNATERNQALDDAKPWMTQNNTALSKIVNAVPKSQMHAVKGIIYAREAWNNLRDLYQPLNSMLAEVSLGDLHSYRCTPTMDVSVWLNDLQGLTSLLSTWTLMLVPIAPSLSSPLATSCLAIRTGAHSPLGFANASVCTTRYNPCRLLFGLKNSLPLSARRISSVIERTRTYRRISLPHAPMTIQNVHVRMTKLAAAHQNMRERQIKLPARIPTVGIKGTRFPVALRMVEVMRAVTPLNGVNRGIFICLLPNVQLLTTSDPPLSPLLPKHPPLMLPLARQSLPHLLSMTPLSSNRSLKKNYRRSPLKLRSTADLSLLRCPSSPVLPRRMITVFTTLELIAMCLTTVPLSRLTRPFVPFQ